MPFQPALLELKAIVQMVYCPAAYRAPKKEKKKTNGHGVELKTDRLALLDARGAGTFDGGAVAALWLPAPDLVCGSRCNQ